MIVPVFKTGGRQVSCRRCVRLTLASAKTKDLAGLVLCLRGKPRGQLSRALRNADGCVGAAGGGEEVLVLISTADRVADREVAIAGKCRRDQDQRVRQREVYPVKLHLAEISP